MFLTVRIQILPQSTFLYIIIVLYDFTDFTMGFSSFVCLVTIQTHSAHNGPHTHTFIHTRTQGCPWNVWQARLTDLRIRAFTSFPLLYILNSFGENHTTPCTPFRTLIRVRSTVFSQQGRNYTENKGKGLIKSVT